jgi:hypothetical protein
MTRKYASQCSCWNCFYRQRRLVIDGKYSSDAGLSTIVKQTSESFKDSRRISSGGIAFLYVQEAQERDRESSDLTRKSRQLLDREKLRRC